MQNAHGGGEHLRAILKKEHDEPMALDGVAVLAQRVAAFGTAMGEKLAVGFAAQGTLHGRTGGQ
ncbi:MAG: hypothetical protein ABIR70_11915 [Bryobacteraceae bacterium]